MSSILKVDQLQDSGGNAILTSDGAGNITTPGITTGKVLQVVSATDSTARSTTSTSFVTASNTLSVSITPSSASSKIFIALSSSIQGSGTNSFYYTIYRDSTNIGATDGMQRLYSALYTPMALSVLDAPSTTSATTYQVYMKTNGGTAYLNSGGLLGTITAMEISA